MQKNKRKFMFFSSLVLLVMLVAIFAPWITPFDPYEAVFSDAFKAPDSTYIFGTDKMGRDLFSRVIYGTRASIFYTLILVVSIFTIGSVIGLTAGYFGGKIDAILMTLCDIMVSFPGMALAIAVCGVMGAGIMSAVIAITMVSFTKYARLARSLVLKEKYKDYISAAKLSGTRDYLIVMRYMLPSVLPALVITATSDMGGMMLELAGFSFLGLGATASTIEWGYMLNEGRQYMESCPWLMFYPGAAIFVTVAIFNLFGDALRDVLDPRNDNMQINNKRKGWFKNMKIFKKAAAALAVVMVASTLLTACGATTGSTQQTGTGEATASDVKHLNFGCYNYSDSIDPIVNVNSSWCGVRYGITECLFKFDENVVAQPNISESYEVSEDYTTWTLKIKDGVQFSNGNVVTASAVVASIERLYKETDADQGGTGNSNPEGYLIYNSIEANDETNEVTIVCAAPTANLPGILSYPYFAIVDTSVIDTEVIGTGPYKVDATNAGVNIDMSRNEYYHDGEVPFDTVNVMLIDDSSTKSMALQNGDIDVAENITTASDLDKLSADENYYVHTAAGVRTGGTYMNYNGVFANEALRQAAIMAIDHETICNVVVGGMYTPGFSVLPSSLAYNYDKLTNPFEYNVDEAVKLLDNAGIVDSDGDGWREIDGTNIDLNYVVYTSRNLNDFAEAISLQLSTVGIKVTVNIRDYDTALALQNAGEFDLITSNSITVGVGDPQDFLGNWYSGNSDSYGYYKNADYDTLYESLMVETDVDKRVEIITDLQQILIDDAAHIVHGYYNSRMISNANIITGAEIATIDYYWITTDIKPAV